MALTPKLEIKQSPSPTLTPQLRQAISLLQMTNLELNEFVEQELVSNPLLEREENLLNNDEPNPSENKIEQEEFANDFDEQNHFDDFGSDTEGYNSFENTDWSDYRQSKIHSSSYDDFDYIRDRLASEKSLYSVIEDQINLAFTSSSDKFIAFFLLQNLDDSGYFTADINSLAAKLKTAPQRLQNILAQMKNFEPSGIFSQNLAECLKIQLQDNNQLTSQLQILLNNLPLLASGKFTELCRLCNCSANELSVMIKQIKMLNPKPAASWNTGFNHNIIPDVIVQRNVAGEYRVELNPLSLPKLLINHRYYSDFKENKSAKRYLRENLSRASFLIKAMHSRATSILRIAEEIILRQYLFFEKGIEHLKPMNIREIAETLSLSESTVSRASSNKYMSTPIGTFEFKYFFSNAAGNYLGNDDISTTAIKHRIKKLIENEDPRHILSDEKLVELLENDGTKIARRTVAKYREAMGIPTSAERKRTARSSKLSNDIYDYNQHN